VYSLTAQQIQRKIEYFASLGPREQEKMFAKVLTAYYSSVAKWELLKGFRLRAHPDANLKKRKRKRGRR
jgi:hypothetical protein